RQLERGLPPESMAALALLAQNRSALILPLIESKLEQVLTSPDAVGLFAGRTVDTQSFTAAAVSIIAEAADEAALRAASRLSRIRDFSGLVTAILFKADTRENAFRLAYRGLALGDPRLERGILAWAEQVLAEPMLNLPSDPRH